MEKVDGNSSLWHYLFKKRERKEKDRHLLSSCVRTDMELLNFPSLVVNAVTQIWYSVNFCKLMSSASVKDISTDTFFKTLAWTDPGASS